MGKYKKKLYKSTIRLSKDIQIIPQLLTNESLSIINKTFVWDNDKLFIRKDLMIHILVLLFNQNFIIASEPT